MSAADWRRFAEVGRLDQFNRKVSIDNPPTPLGELIRSATEFAKTCHEDRPAGRISVRQALTCFLEHCLKEEPEENEEDIERIEDLLEDPHPDQYPHDEHVGLDCPEGYGS